MTYYSFSKALSKVMKGKGVMFRQSWIRNQSLSEINTICVCYPYYESVADLIADKHPQLKIGPFNDPYNGKEYLPTTSDIFARDWLYFKTEHKECRGKN